MGLNQMGLGFIFTAKDEASRVMDSVERKFVKLDTTTQSATESFQKGAGQMAVGSGVLAAGVLTVAAGVKLANISGEFEMAMAKVGAISQASAADMEQLREAALQSGTAFKPTESAKALENLAAQGFNAQESIKGLPGVLNLAQGGMISLDQSSNAVSAAIKVFSLSADDAVSVADKMLKISNTTSLAAGDMELAMGAVARGASAAGQNLDEMLVAMGLVKNTGVDVSVAATAVSSALQYVASKASSFKALGVSVTDSHGKFRNFVDIVQDTQKVLSKIPNEATRTAQATELFSRFGVSAYQAISTQLAAGVRDANGQLLQGNAALEEMRRQMKEAGGTSQEFSDKMANTLEGQKNILGAAKQRLMTVLGEGFAFALKPLVMWLGKGMDKLKELINRIPADTRTKLAKVVLGVGAVIAALGGLLAAKAGIALFILTLKLLGVTIAGILTPLLPVAAALGVIILLVKGFQAAMGNSSSGVLDWLKEVGAKLWLFAEAMMQLFSEGGFSGRVRKELNAAGNGGVKDFAITVFMWVARIKNFFSGLADGFAATAATMRPIWEALKGAFISLGEALGFTTTSADANAAAFDSAGSAGNRTGQVLAQVAGAIAQAITIVIAVIEMAIGIIKELWAIVGPIFISIAQRIGETVSFVMALLQGDWTKAWQSAVNIVLSVCEGIINALAGVIRVVGRVIEGVGQLLGKNWDITGKIEEMRASIIKDAEFLKYDMTAHVAPAPTPLPVSAASNAPHPAVAAVAAQVAATREGGANVGAAVAAAMPPAQPQTINLNTVVQMDGEKVGQAQQRIQREQRARALLPMTPAHAED